MCECALTCAAVQSTLRQDCGKIRKPDCSEWQTRRRLANLAACQLQDKRTTGCWSRTQVRRSRSKAETVRRFLSSTRKSSRKRASPADAGGSATRKVGFPSFNQTWDCSSLRWGSRSWSWQSHSGRKPIPVQMKPPDIRCGPFQRWPTPGEFGLP